MAEIYERITSNDQILILRHRESATQPFSPPNWTDIRIGMFVSLTQLVNDDNPTGLAESFTSQTTFDPGDWMWIGLKDHSPDLPGVDGPINFIGFTNQSSAGSTTDLVTSDLGYGSSAYYWRMTSLTNPVHSTFAALYDGTRVLGPNTIQSHFFQSTDPGNPAPPGYYCGMLGFRLTRTSSSSNLVTIQIPQVGSNSADMLWTNAPTKANLLAAFDPWPTSVVTLGPVNFGVIPDALFAYSPFSNSRLRISSWGVFQKS